MDVRVTHRRYFEAPIKVLSLASDEASFVKCVEFFVDGGQVQV